jgi:hypothetical protein
MLKWVTIQQFILWMLYCVESDVKHHKPNHLVLMLDAKLCAVIQATNYTRFSYRKWKCNVLGKKCVQIPKGLSKVRKPKKDINAMAPKSTNIMIHKPLQITKDWVTEKRQLTQELAWKTDTTSIVTSVTHV